MPQGHTLGWLFPTPTVEKETAKSKEANRRRDSTETGLLPEPLGLSESPLGGQGVDEPGLAWRVEGGGRRGGEAAGEEQGRGRGS